MLVRKIESVLAIALISLILFCQSAKAAGTGTSTGEFLKLGIGARAAGLGGAYTAVCNDATSIYWNPAGLSSDLDYSFSVMHAVWIDKTYFDFIGYSQKIQNIGTVGMGVQYFNAGSIKETDETGLIQGAFTPKDVAVNLAWAREFWRIPLGVNIKYINSQIKNKASAISLDAGLKLNFYDRLEVALVGQNLIGQLKYVEEENPLPQTYKVGTRTYISANTFWALDIVKQRDRKLYYNFGIEYGKKIGVMEDKKVAVRTGYSTKTAGDIEGLSGLAVGFGLGLEKFDFDYAWTPYGDLGQTHRISVSYGF